MKVKLTTTDGTVYKGALRSGPPRWLKSGPPWIKESAIPNFHIYVKKKFVEDLSSREMEIYPGDVIEVVK